MYKYGYSKRFDPENKIVTQIGIEQADSDSGVYASISFTNQLNTAQKSLLDQVMTDRGYTYATMVTGGSENYLVAISPNGTIWKVSCDDSGVLVTDTL